MTTFGSLCPYRQADKPRLPKSSPRKQSLYPRKKYLQKESTRKQLSQAQHAPRKRKLYFLAISPLHRLPKVMKYWCTYTNLDFFFSPPLAANDAHEWIRVLLKCCVLFCIYFFFFFVFFRSTSSELFSFLLLFEETIRCNATRILGFISGHSLRILLHFWTSGGVRLN